MGKHPLVAVLFINLTCSILGSTCQAEMRLTGDGEIVRIDIGGETLDEAITALGAKYSIRVRTALPLNERLTGAHEGTPLQLIRAILDRYNYFVLHSEDAVEVVILGRQSGMPSIAVPRSTSALPALPAPPPGSPMPNRGAPPPVQPTLQAPKVPPLPPVPRAESPGIPQSPS